MVPFFIILITSIAVYASSGLTRAGFFVWGDLGFPLAPLQQLYQNLFLWDHFSNLPVFLAVHLLSSLSTLSLNPWILFRLPHARAVENGGLNEPPEIKNK